VVCPFWEAHAGAGDEGILEESGWDGYASTRRVKENTPAVKQDAEAISETTEKRTLNSESGRSRSIIFLTFQSREPKC